MKRLLLSSAVILALAAGGYACDTATGGGQALAAPAAGPGLDAPGPDALGADAPGPDAPGPDGIIPMGPGPAGPHGDMGPGFPPPPGGRPGIERWHAEEQFGLFPRQADKKLSPEDVKTIADAILLEHGNHSWTVSNVAAQSDKSIDFSFATAHGDVIATFAVDPASGRIKRVS